MQDKEIFDLVLKTLAERYGLDVAHPYGDAYFELKKGTASLGGMNPAGKSLLANIAELSDLLRLLRPELR